MEQMVNYKHYKSQWMTVIILTLMSAMFLVMGLFPLVGLWIQLAALFSGALLLPPLLAPRKVKSLEMAFSLPCDELCLLVSDLPLTTPFSMTMATLRRGIMGLHILAGQ